MPAPRGPGILPGFCKTELLMVPHPAPRWVRGSIRNQDRSSPIAQIGNGGKSTFEWKVEGKSLGDGRVRNCPLRGCPRAIQVAIVASSDSIQKPSSTYHSAWFPKGSSMSLGRLSALTVSGAFSGKFDSARGRGHLKIDFGLEERAVRDRNPLIPWPTQKFQFPAARNLGH